MNRLMLAVTLLASVPALAEPVQIDLTAEKSEYQRKVLDRTLGWIFLGTTVASAGAAGYGYVSALQTQSTLQAEKLPVNLNTRTNLISQGQQANLIGLIGLIAFAATGITTAVFLGISF